MTFVAAHQFAGRDASVSFTVPSAAGEVLLGLVSSPGQMVVSSGAADVSRLSAPSGWVVRGLWSSVATGDPQRIEGALAVISTSAPGASSGVVSWDGAVPAGLRLTVLRFSGMKGVRGVGAAQLNAQWMTFPAVAAPAAATGHAVRVAVGPASSWAADYADSDLVPAGHALRASAQTSRSRDWLGGWTTPNPSFAVASEQSLSGVAPATVSAAYRGAGWGVTIYLASTIGPAAPSITAPSESNADLTAGLALSWTPSGAQTGVRIRRKLSTGVDEFLTALVGGSWTSTPTTITTTGVTATISAGQFDAGGAVYDLGVATVGDATAPDLGDEAVVTVTSWAAPTATNVSVPLTIGGVVASRVPVVTATGTAGSGSTLNRMDVEVVDAVTGVVCASGSHPPGGSFAVPVEKPLPNGAFIKLRARAIQNGEQPSAWIERGPWTVSVPTPPAPLVSVQPWTHPVSGLPGRRVTVSQIDAAGVGAVSLSRDDLDMGAYPAPGTAASPGIITVDDYSLPPDETVTYSATVTDAATPANTGPAASATTMLASAEVHCWLLDPLDPAGAVHAPVAAIGAASVSLATTASQPLGQSRFLVRSLVASDESGSLTLTMWDPDAIAKAKTLLTSGRRIMLRGHGERDRDGVTHAARDLLFRPVGELQIVRPAPGVPLSWRRITFDWVAQ